MSEQSDKLLKGLDKEYGSDILISGRAVSERTKEIVSVSPAVDIGLGGGVPTGSWFILAGLPKYGKTTLSLQTAANFQKLNSENEVYFLSVEGRLKRRDLLGIHGLDVDRVHVIQSTEDKILTAQDFLTIGERILMECKKCMLIVDSFSALCHGKVVQEGVGTSTRGGNAVLLAQFCSAMGNVVPVKNQIVIGITHLMANTGGSYGGLSEKGGFAIQYQVDAKLRAKSREYWTSGDKTVGQKVKWLVETTALDAPPQQEVESYLRYGYGLDEAMELNNMGVQLGIVNKNKGWHSFQPEGFEEIKSNGEDNFVITLKEQPIYLAKLQEAIYSMIL